MAAVQVMRAKAQAAGTLASTPQIQVVQQSPSTIVIQPADPQVVYVPQYNPAVVYGVPYVVPFYTPPVFAGVVVGAGISFGGGVSPSHVEVAFMRAFNTGMRPSFSNLADRAS